MIPVHVIVSDRIEDERQYAEAFSGAIDLYRFRSNVEAFERLTGAQAPVHVLVVTPNQDSLFNMSGRQLAARLTASPIGSSNLLAGMQIVVVGEQVDGMQRVHGVGSLDAAVRLIKFGEVESAPMPAAPARAEAAQPEAGQASGFLPSLISSIWDAPDPAAASAPGAARPAAGTAWQHAQAPAAYGQQHAQASAPYGQQHAQAPAPYGQQHAQAPAPYGQQHAPAAHQPLAPTAPTSLVQTPRGIARMRDGVDPVAGVPVAPAQAAGGLFAHQPATQGVPNGELLPARDVRVPSRGEYRGRPLRGSTAMTNIHARNSAPVPSMQDMPQQADVATPPGLASQVHHLVYSPQQTSANDPLLAFSAQTQAELAQQQSVPALSSIHAHHVDPMYAAQTQHVDPMYAAQAQQAGPYAQPGAPMYAAQAQQAGHEAPHVHGTSSAAAGQQQRRGVAGGISRMRQRIRESEAPPMVPNAAPQGHAAQVSNIFDAPPGIMQRSDAAGDVAFG